MKRQDYSDKRLYSLFTESILDPKYNNTIKDGEKKSWSLDKLQSELCYDEQIDKERVEKLRVLVARRAGKDSPGQPKKEGSNPKNNKGKGGGGDKSNPKQPSEEAQATWKQLRVTIEKKYWSVLTEEQQKKFKGMDDRERSVWWGANASEIKKKKPAEENTSEKSSDGSKDNPSDKSTKKVNWETKTRNKWTFLYGQIGRRFLHGD